MRKNIERIGFLREERIFHYLYIFHFLIWFSYFFFVCNNWVGLYLEFLNNGENIIWFLCEEGLYLEFFWIMEKILYGFLCEESWVFFKRVCVHTLGDNVMVVLEVVEVERQGDKMTPSWRDPRRMSNGNKIYWRSCWSPLSFAFFH